MGQDNNYNTYLGCAENDYYFFAEDIQKGRVANYLASMAQNICERYLKHIINSEYNPTSTEENNDKMTAMRSHNLQKLFQTIEQHTEMKFSLETKNNLRQINGYYFSTRYPGEEYIEVTSEDMEICKNAVELCRNSVMEHISETQTKDNEQKYDIDELLERTKIDRQNCSEELEQEKDFAKLHNDTIH